jgi:hypothetical protein
MYVSAPSGGGSGAGLILMLMFMMCCSSSFMGVGYYLFTRGEEGDVCTIDEDTDDPHGVYTLDSNIECQFTGCEAGYAQDLTGKCVVDQSGEDCEEGDEAMTDGNANYETNVTGDCVFKECMTGFTLEGDPLVCTEIEDDSA